MVQSLSYKPTCMAVSHGYIAVGGQRGELHILEQGGASVFGAVIGASATNGAYTHSHLPDCMRTSSWLVE